MFLLRNQIFGSKDTKAGETQLRAFKVFDIFGHNRLRAACDGEFHYVIVRLVR